MTTTGEDLKLDGMESALDGAPVSWKQRARDVIWTLSLTGAEFTSEDVVEVAGLPRPGAGSNRNNAVGAVMAGAARAGWIVKTGRYVEASRTRSHARALAVWIGR